MKCLYATLFLLILSFQLPAQQLSDTLKIISYNLRFGERASMEEFAEYIKAQDADLVALQEVDIKTFRERAPQQNGKDFIGELAHMTGMFAAFGKTIDYAGGYYGIGILSKYPMSATERILLPFTDNGKEQRALLVANIELANDKTIAFASTHLDYTNTEERQLQVNLINEILLSKSIPVLIGGDFNARPASIEISEGMSSWSLLDNQEPTSPAKEAKYKIDYIFGYPKTSWKLLSAPTQTSLLSDHLPVVAEVKVIW
ncbi:endonuclease [Echinicola strongylocentroti]|uniref:Endonuclease n=1 Tax=Echinicola strongylocentroti TaxID=1795355 RepID=A0A2Z4IRN2_9BACT|nr:endonuclease/exonuclease/phosphatase family protein [Echinicola strongylocentroti]AWW32963.1 endonuclease [Echinicola strongylocentroti]